MVLVSPATASTRMPRILLFLYAGCILLSLLSHHVAAAAAASPPPSFSFDFSNTSSYRLQDLRFEGDAALHDNLVDLTCNSKEQEQSMFCKGRMSYNHPVPFYDNNTGEVASFATQFTFAIKLNNGVKRGDGMSFFLSSYPSILPPSSSGSFLGLIDSNETTAFGAGRFVAVEFDTYNNPWDPTGSSDHIGIDISSVRDSVSTTRLPSFSLNGTMTAFITFNNSTRMLSASLHFDDHPSLGPAQVITQLPDPLATLLPPEVAVGFSAGTGGYFELHQILFWSFNSTMARKETPGANNVQPKQGQALGDKGHSIDARVIIGGAVLSVPVVWFILSCFMWKRARVSFVKRAGLGEFRRFEYHDLVEATGKFSVENMLGEGAFGVVHKGILRKYNGQQEEVAVKKIKESALGETNAFLDELKASSQTSHKNLVKLKGWCCSRNKWKLSDFMCCRQQQNADLFLVYELVPNGSLHDHLYKDKPGQAVLPWVTRYEIVKGIGSALRYLHHECNPYILHRDIKPCNILLDAGFNPKLADFGLSRIADDNNTILPTMAIGTEGYMDPLCRKNGKVKFSRTSDVYSFGIVLLDIACTGKTPDLVREMYRRSGPEKFFEHAADVKLYGAFDRMQMQQVAVLGLWCCFPHDTQRPSLLEAMKVLENDTPLLQKAMEILEHGTELPDQYIIEKEGGDSASSMT